MTADFSFSRVNNKDNAWETITEEVFEAKKQEIIAEQQTVISLKNGKN